ncbi:MAG: tyrosine-type recombinase/integrase [Bacilli bacterium]|nr:tyrosine-type recombinase/integrase [Bacilli bacterium]
MEEFKKQDLYPLVDEWINEQYYQEYSDNTLKQYKANVLKFVDWMDDDEILTKDTTIRFKNYVYNLEPRPKTSTINTWIIEINKFLKYIDRKDLTLKKIKMQVKTSNNEVLTIADYKRLLRFAKRKNNMQLYYIIKVLAMTGIRISELKYFTVENIKENYIDGFNKGKERKIILRQDLARELRKYARDNNIKTGYIFRGAKKGCMPNKATIWKQLKKTAGAARVNKKKVHAHSFRHLFAQIFLESYPGAITELADILGHNSLETTRLYTRTSNKQKKSKMEQMSFK